MQYLGLLIPAFVMIVLSFVLINRALKRKDLGEESYVMAFFSIPFVALTYALKTEGWFNNSLAIVNSILYTISCYVAFKPLYRFIHEKFKSDIIERFNRVNKMDAFIVRWTQLAFIAYAVFFTVGILTQNNLVLRLPQLFIFTYTTGCIVYFIKFLVENKIFGFRVFINNILFPAWMISWIEIVNFIYVCINYSKYSDWNLRNTYIDPFQMEDTIWILFCLIIFFAVPRLFKKSIVDK